MWCLLACSYSGIVNHHILLCTDFGPFRISIHHRPSSAFPISSDLLSPWTFCQMTVPDLSPSQFVVQRPFIKGLPCLRLLSKSLFTSLPSLSVHDRLQKNDQWNHVYSREPASKSIVWRPQLMSNSLAGKVSANRSSVPDHPNGVEKEQLFAMDGAD
jgi:hypothetical protein